MLARWISRLGWLLWVGLLAHSSQLWLRSWCRSDVKGHGDTSSQCKHTKRGAYDGCKAIQEISGAKIKYSKELGVDIETLIFATNAKMLSAKTKEIARQYDVQIFSYSEIIDLLSKYPVTYKMVLIRLSKKRLDVRWVFQKRNIKFQAGNQL